MKFKMICLFTLVAAAAGCSTPSAKNAENADSSRVDTVQKDTVRDTYNPAAAPATNGQF